MKSDSNLNELNRLRDALDELDERIVVLLAERFRMTHTIGAIKLSNDLPVSLPDRVQHRAALIRTLAQRHALDPEAALAIYAGINRETVVEHRRQGVRPNH